MSDQKQKEFTAEQAKLIVNNMPNPFGGMLSGWKKTAADEVIKIVDDELNQKRSVFKITISNYYDVYENETINKLGGGCKGCFWKYFCCGLWSCRNCCCKKRCLCSCCFMITTDARILKKYAKILSNELIKTEVKHQLTILDNNVIQIVLLHVSKSWLDKAKELAVEHVAPVIIKQQMETILNDNGVKHCNISWERKLIDVSQEEQKELDKNDTDNK